MNILPLLILLICVCPIITGLFFVPKWYYNHMWHTFFIGNEDQKTKTVYLIRYKRKVQ